MIEHIHSFTGNIIGRIGIRISNQDTKRILRATQRLESRTRYQSNNVPRLCSVDYMNLLVRNIMTEKHPPYAKYHPRYEAWKAQYGVGHGYWRLMGALVKSINTRRVPVTSGAYAWFSGIPSSAKTSGTSWFANRPGVGKIKQISWYARIMEYGSNRGGQKHPPRPIVGPTFDDYKTSGRFEYRGINGLKALKRTWR